jgi:hypothetical protein
VAIGNLAGLTLQGGNAIAIGNKAGQTAQHLNSIILNASGAILNSATASSFYVSSVRNDTVNTGNIIAYNPITKEISYFAGTNGATGSTSWTDASGSVGATGWTGWTGATGWIGSTGWTG